MEEQRLDLIHFAVGRPGDPIVKPRMEQKVEKPQLSSGERVIEQVRNLALQAGLQFSNKFNNDLAKVKNPDLRYQSSYSMLSKVVMDHINDKQDPAKSLFTKIPTTQEIAQKVQELAIMEEFADKDPDYLERYAKLNLEDDFRFEASKVDLDREFAKFVDLVQEARENGELSPETELILRLMTQRPDRSLERNAVQGIRRMTSKDQEERSYNFLLCKDSECYFARRLPEFDNSRASATIYVDEHGVPILFQKTGGYKTDFVKVDGVYRTNAVALSLTEVVVGGVVYPPGTILGLDTTGEPGEVNNTHNLVRSTTDILRARPQRLSLFALNPNERNVFEGVNDNFRDSVAVELRREFAVTLADFKNLANQIVEDKSNSD